MAYQPGAPGEIGFARNQERFRIKGCNTTDKPATADENTNASILFRFFTINYNDFEGMEYPKNGRELCGEKIFLSMPVRRRKKRRTRKAYALVVLWSVVFHILLSRLESLHIL
jgi:hypothetical protein